MLCSIPKKPYFCNLKKEYNYYILSMNHPVLEKLESDVRFQEALSSCMNCGVCTAICPAAEFYKYDPRMICTIVQSRQVEEIIELLKSETIWYCGQCMSCKPRCPRGNAVGLIITVLRKISQEMGYFIESEKGRQQLAVERLIGHSILDLGYCVHPDIVAMDLHPEQGPVWEWFLNHIEEVSEKLGAKYHQETAGALRKIKEENLKEIKNIFDVTGGTAFYENIEFHSEKAAAAMNKDFGDDYTLTVYKSNSGDHTRDH